MTSDRKEKTSPKSSQNIDREKSRSRENNRDSPREKEGERERERAKERDRNRERNQKERTEKRNIDKSKDVSTKSPNETKSRSDQTRVGRQRTQDNRRLNDKTITDKGNLQTGSISDTQNKDRQTREKIKLACDNATKQILKDHASGVKDLASSLSDNTVSELARSIEAKDIAVKASSFVNNGKTTFEVRIVSKSGDGRITEYAARIDPTKPDGFRSEMRELWNEKSILNPEFTPRFIESPGSSAKSKSPRIEKLASTPSLSISPASSKKPHSLPKGQSSHKQPTLPRREKLIAGKGERMGVIKNPNRAVLPSPVIRVLQDIMKMAGLKMITVTRTTTTVRDQARIMFDNIKSKGIQKSYDLYGKIGKQVVKVFEKNKDSPNKQDIISKMEAKIEELGLGNVTHHGDDSRYVIDIAPSTMSQSEKKAFERAVRNTPEVDKARFIKPPKDPAYHIEILKSHLTK